MGSTGGTDSILWLNNSYALIDINQIAEGQIKVLLKNSRFPPSFMLSEMF